ncbi:Non-histone chromosomal protein 6 [Lunasporangiospora selenospora]|uniref:Non-histone chromosomal protein 6 n=1 Tax=Lunasporangiospora selenospora TaxID=979761 RepID=A0A9P6KGI4_9FUNG|nr:Non-histone chromosomal protein 6 [Lunasporangiospora selenospora]
MPKVAKKDTKPAKRSKEPEKKKKRKMKKDPNAPKAPLSAYLLFCGEYREKVRAENPDASFGTIGRLLGERWAKLADQQKTPYITKHEKAKAKYSIEKAAYDAKKKAAASDDDDDEEEESD